MSTFKYIYMYLLRLFVSKKIEVLIFERVFLQIRRAGSYWLSGSFRSDIGRVLDAFFLDVDEYFPEELYDAEESLGINEVALRDKAKKALEELLALTEMRI